jgi:hypothetical protein
MKQGLLWFDNDPRRSVEEKITQAVERYAQKFGRQPNTCYVNPQMVAASEEPRVLRKVRVVTAQNILPHHFWLGVARSGRANSRKRTP